MRRYLTFPALAAAVVLVLAACTEQDPLVSEEDQVPEDVAQQAEGPDEDDNDEPADADQTVEFVAGDMYYDDLPDSVSAGVVEFVMENEGASEHDMVIEELGDEQIVPMTAGGDTGSGTAELDAGTYTLYCSVPGHREAGMEAELEAE